MKAILYILPLLFVIRANCQEFKTLKSDHKIAQQKDQSYKYESSDHKLSINGNFLSDDLQILREKYPNTQCLDLSNATIIPSSDNSTKENHLPASFFSPYGDSAYFINIRSVILPQSLKGICNFAFVGCDNLDTIYIPVNVQSIYSQALKGFSGHITVDPLNTSFLCVDGILMDRSQSKILYVPKTSSTLFIPNSVSSFDFSLIQDTNIEILLNPDNSNYKMLEGIVYNHSVTALLFCPRNKSGDIEIPNTVETIFPDAFNGCELITGISLPSSINTIGARAFKGCSLLKTMVLPENVSSLENGVFEGCRMIESITIPQSLQSIGANVFKDCNSLTGIFIPSGITKLNTSVFENCKKLEHLQLPDSVLFIGNNAFKGCSNLKSIQVNDQLVEIGSFAFNECQSLEAFSIPSSVEKIGGGIFNNCKNLRTINIYAQNPIAICSFSENLFENTNIEELKLFVPFDAVDLYSSDKNWNAIPQIFGFNNTDKTASLALINDLVPTNNDVKIYPNPTSDGFYLDGTFSTGILSIFDLNGRLLQHQDVSEHDYISVRHLLQGTYMVRIKTEDCISEHKLIKKTH